MGRESRDLQGERAEGLKWLTKWFAARIASWGDEFRPMLSRAEYWFICQKCGHIAMPGKPEFKCFCQKCSKLIRAA